jgi:hypothetical protein
MNPGAPQASRHAAQVPGLPGPQAAAPPGDDHTGGTPRRLLYERLARVSVLHEYYGGACRDFAVRPTRHTAGLLRRLGLLFRPEDAGFSVLYDHLGAGSLMEFIRNRRGRGEEPWTRLCFVLSLRNPSFVAFTELPADTNPARQNLYLTNRRAHAPADSPVLLSPGPRVTGDDRVPVNGGRFVETVDAGVARVRVLDVSGEEVMCSPATVRPGGSERLHFDLGGLPEELYRVQVVPREGTAPEPREFLYTSAYPVPLGFVELLLADPDGAPGSVYPVRGLGTPDEAIEGVSYEIRFAARRTWWSYYVVADAPGGGPGEMRIRQRRAPGEDRVAFLGPCRVRLAGGRPAWWFVSRREIPLARRPTLHLQLVWRREGSRRVDVLMERLPLPSGEQVLPMDPGEACVQARSRPCDAPERMGHRCRRLLDSLCGAPPVAGLPRRIFSDIYVHV